jgi:hypothetical protein
LRPISAPAKKTADKRARTTPVLVSFTLSREPRIITPNMTIVIPIPIGIVISSCRILTANTAPKSGVVSIRGVLRATPRRSTAINCRSLARDGAINPANNKGMIPSSPTLEKGVNIMATGQSTIAFTATDANAVVSGLLVCRALLREIEERAQLTAAVIASISPSTVC